MVSSLSLFFISLSLLQPCFLLVAGDLAFTQRTCKQCARSSPNVTYNFCVASLQSDPESGAGDLKGLGYVAIKLALANATETIAYMADQLEHNGTLDDSTRNVLVPCSQLYSSAKTALDYAMESFQISSYDDAIAKLSTAVDYPTECDDGFEGGHVPTPLKERDANLSQLSAIAIAIAHLLASA